MTEHTGSTTRPHLSKSRVVACWKCPRYLWWKVFKPDAPELQPSVADQDRMDQGTAVGELATKRFPGGVLIDLPYHQMRGKVEATREALAAGAPAIFEASFWEDEVFVAVDILERRGKAFRLIEVKATTRVKEEHIPDAAVQLHVLRKAGLDVQEVALMHLNKEYRHPGPEPLFSLSDLTPEAEAMLPEIPGLIQSSHDVLAGPDPGPCIGNQWGRPWECALDESCWPEDPDHIRHLYGIGPKKALELMADGIHTFDDLISRLADLKEVLEKNLAHPDFHGSYSIKDVLTPMVPDLTYDGLASNLTRSFSEPDGEESRISL